MDGSHQGPPTPVEIAWQMRAARQLESNRCAQWWRMPSSRAAPTTRAMWLAPPSRKINRSCAIAPIGPIPQSQQRDWEAAGPGRPRGRRVLRHSCQHNKRKNDELRNSDDLSPTLSACRQHHGHLLRRVENGELWRSCRQHYIPCRQHYPHTHLEREHFSSNLHE
jgi:hypothetical protein